MTTEIKMDQLLIVLTEPQARFLIDLSRFAAAYRGSWESLMDRGQKEIARLNNNQWVSGPNHQVMAEVQQEYGKIKAMLDMSWSVFSVIGFDEEDRKRGVAEIEKFIAIALAEPTKNAGLSGGTWFREGFTLADF